MSGPARMLATLRRAIEIDTRRGYVATLERHALQTRARVLASRIIEGRA